ncbi:MAG: hypothetical protein KJ795_03620 [Gammaproteobacteria bacterium]|nr:hypothetical protein [Gammaproteobacteria bacterium]MBU1777244.1 hypothetical protein [Gammaproteobacteria bacterium]MBU1967860.1 hypothetical protein [Gammaproteobacteria bacterium]
MNKSTIKPLCLAIGLALAGPVSAVSLDLTGANIYMKFLDGSQIGAPSGSIDTASGGDQGQFTEMNLTFKATISPKVEAGGRIQSRSSAAYWTEFGGFGQEGSVANNEVNHQKMMKLRGAYVELSPGYDWLTQVRIGTSDWGMFDPFTVGKIRYIDRDNYNGFYFKGPMVSGSTWEFARVSLPSYLQYNWGNGATCCSSDSTQYNEAVYIAQFKVPVGAAKMAASYMSFIDHTLGTTTNQYAGVNTKAIYKNTVLALKADGSPADGIDLRGAYYRSTSENSGGTVGEVWGNAPRATLNDRAIKLDVDWTTPVENLSLSYQYFNIGAGYYSTAAARRESDVLLTEGSEAAWYNWGTAIWSGGATSDYTQSASNRSVTDNAYMDFNESPAESSVGWKGHTIVGKYEVAETPMSLELTLLDYNNNWQNYSATGPLSNFYALNQDRKTNILAYKLNHNFDVMGGLDAGLKVKRVDDKNNVSAATTADDRDVLDNGVTASVGNQLFDDLYGTLSFGRYTREIKSGANTFNNKKSIYGVKFAYNLPGFEMGVLAQWIKGTGNPTETVGAGVDIRQYRMKAFAQVNF